MKLIVKTTYDHIDMEWLIWYLKRLANEEVLPGSTIIAKDLERSWTAQFSSKDPTSNVIATTYYEVSDCED